MFDFPVQQCECTQDLILHAIKRRPAEFYKDVEVRRRRQFRRRLSVHAAFCFLIVLLLCTRPSEHRTDLAWLCTTGLQVELCFATIALALCTKLMHVGLLLPWPRILEKGCRRSRSQVCARIVLSTVHCWWAVWSAQLLIGGVVSRGSFLQCFLLGCVALWPFTSVLMHSADKNEQLESMKGIAAGILLGGSPCAPKAENRGRERAGEALRPWRSENLFKDKARVLALERGLP
mmetsp:Transcript_35814/g.94919  ORF Transcript_35814/g.94919 Transcript_35814/m.94919 type:complete len:233 (-) Transcript_35814:224-922(-)